MMADYNGWADQSEEEREALDQLEMTLVSTASARRHLPALRGVLLRAAAREILAPRVKTGRALVPVPQSCTTGRRCGVPHADQPLAVHDTSPSLVEWIQAQLRQEEAWAPETDSLGSRDRRSSDASLTEN